MLLRPEPWPRFALPEVKFFGSSGACRASVSEDLRTYPGQRAPGHPAATLGRQATNLPELRQIQASIVLVYAHQAGRLVLLCTFASSRPYSCDSGVIRRLCGESARQVMPRAPRRDNATSSYPSLVQLSKRGAVSECLRIGLFPALPSEINQQRWTTASPCSDEQKRQGVSRGVPHELVSKGCCNNRTLRQCCL